MNGEKSPLLKRWIESTPNEELWTRVRDYRKDPLFIEHLKTGARRGFVDATSLVPLFVPDDLEWLIPELKELPHPWWREEEYSDAMIQRAFREIEAYVNHEKPADIPGWFAFEFDPAEGVESLHYLERM